MTFQQVIHGALHKRQPYQLSETDRGEAEMKQRREKITDLGPGIKALKLSHKRKAFA